MISTASRTICPLVIKVVPHHRPPPFRFLDQLSLQFQEGGSSSTPVPVQFTNGKLMLQTIITLQAGTFKKFYF
jgi:hypothetical protein